MGWKWRAPAASGTTIAASAALLESLIIAGLTLYGSQRRDSAVIYCLGVAGVAALIFFMAGILLSRRMLVQQHRVSQDLSASVWDTAESPRSPTCGAKPAPGMKRCTAIGS
jgi:hypothetical protein